MSVENDNGTTVKGKSVIAANEITCQCYVVVNTFFGTKLHGA